MTCDAFVLFAANGLDYSMSWIATFASEEDAREFVQSHFDGRVPFIIFETTAQFLNDTPGLFIEDYRKIDGQTGYTVEYREPHWTETMYG